jgi:murein L,D-transpeptidase YafK
MLQLKYLLLTIALLPGLTRITPGPGDGRLDPDKIDRDKIFLLIDKTNYRLYLYEDTKLLRTYKVVFGSNNLGDKRMEGDKETPEGTFHIVDKRYDKRWNRFMLLDYPNDESVKKFNYRKAHGLIPPGAKIGGGIGIHGVRPRVQLGIDLRVNWTDGCIGMKNADVEELYNIVKIGTPVVIRR